MASRTLAGWGNFPRVACNVRRPESLRALEGLIQSPAIARGLGRSYGDQALAREASVLELTALDRILQFDPERGLVRCEAGMSLSELIRLFAPRGFFPAVSPGTKFVTVGGCIANDVHGKAHHVDGCFSTSVEDFELLVASGETLRCSREEHAELFWATMGGLGLTGVVLRATLRLRRVETTFFRQQALAVRNLEELLDAFEQFAEQPFSVAWIDPLSQGKALGRGVLTVGDHARRDELPPKLARTPLWVPPPGRLALPFELPNSALNPLSLRALNAVIGRVQKGAGKFTHYNSFLYPLDAIAHWNRGYGRRGFTQYQFVLPEQGGAQTMRTLLQQIAQSGHLPFLNVLKKLGPAGPGHLSFPRRGYTLAIDFPISKNLPEFITKLDQHILDAGGRIYLGKDALLHAESLPKMYPRLDEWRSIKAQYDPQARFRSHLSARLGLTP